MLIMLTILAHGTFDLLHPGHLEHLEQARAMGDRLIVSVTSDQYVTKGPGRPLVTQEQRMAMIKALRFVDEVYLCDSPSAVPAIEQWRPDVYVRGPDYVARKPNMGKLALERQAVEAYGGRIAFTDGATMSSTALINRSNGRVISRTPADITAWLDKAAAVKMHLLGEQIVDEYIYAQAEGKSPKENIVTYRRLGSRVFPGGIRGISNHIQGLATVSLVNKPADAIMKRRYVIKPFYQKVFSTVTRHEVPPFFIPDAMPSPLLVADYGHGLIRGKTAARNIAERTQWLALMVQSNSLNWGYNLLTKWPRADYFVADEAEIRLARSDRWTPIQDLLVEEYTRLHATIGVVTMGHEGCMVYDGKDMVTIPALATKVVDRMGAGDAFLAWTAPLAFLGAPIDIIAFVGNVAGGIQVGIVGNEEPVDRQMVNQWVKGLLA